MKTSNSILISQAKESLKGKWGLAIGGYLLFYLITTGIGMVPKIGFVAVLIVGGPFLLGLQSLYLSIARNQDTKIEQIFSGFNSFGKALAAYLLMFLYILLWMLLFIVPGFIAAFSYSMTFFILVDEPSIGVSEALNKSKQMMKGNKGKLFILILPFIALPMIAFLFYFILIIVSAVHGDLTAIARHSGFFDTLQGKIVIPGCTVLMTGLFVWMYVATAKFYDDIKPKDFVNEIEG